MIQLQAYLKSGTLSGFC